VLLPGSKEDGPGRKMKGRRREEGQELPERKEVGLVRNVKGRRKDGHC
jgi:hypothetical protein